MTGAPPPRPFTKMAGGGNDFIVLGARDAEGIPDMPRFVRQICRRGMSVGADGVLIVGPSESADVRLAHYNADGGRSSLCGNGTRCAARWARLRGTRQESLHLETDAGPVEARFRGGGRVDLHLGFSCAAPEARQVKLEEREVAGFFLQVGVPHFLIEVPEVDDAPVEELGPRLRRHPSFAPRGTNVSFVARQPDGSLAIRTFERGVEAETLSCGTGCIAAGVLAVSQGWSSPPVACHTRSGIELTVGLAAREGGYGELSLEGDARVVYEGRLAAEALRHGA